jgi:DNA-binding winged helix-turn-helix (wHTH) protein
MKFCRNIAEIQLGQRWPKLPLRLAELRTGREVAMSAAAEVACYRFDGFSLDLVRGGLVTATGVEVPLRHKSYRLLRLFVENANRLLDRDMISQAIWPGVSVADDGISQCVRDIRRALGDHSQTRVRAVPHRGYIKRRLFRTSKRVRQK